MLAALDFHLGPTPEIVILGSGDRASDSNTAAALADLRHRFIPNKVVACRTPPTPSNPSPALAPLFGGKTPQQPLPTVFICENFTCQAPLTGAPAAIDAWKQLAD
jgi:hypothetical protein